MKLPVIILLLCSAMIWACENPSLPINAKADVAIKDKLKGTWVPVSLSINYQIGVAPNQKDTVVSLTPTTSPLLVSNRTNAILAFTDTLYFNTRTAKLDTFFLMNRGIKQQANFMLSTTTGEEGTSTMLKIGRPTYTKGIITRWNFDFVFHGNVTLAANNTPAYAVTTYANYSPTISSITDSQLVLSFSSPGSIANLPAIPITVSNQSSNAAWVGRPVIFKATYQKR
jgi:hypothetical protein